LTSAPEFFTTATSSFSGATEQYSLCYLSTEKNVELPHFIISTGRRGLKLNQQETSEGFAN